MPAAILLNWITKMKPVPVAVYCYIHLSAALMLRKIQNLKNVEIWEY
jgi:hypothetical protein